MITKKFVTKKCVIWCLQKEGYVIYSDRYEIEDPFFWGQWVLEEME